MKSQIPEVMSLSMLQSCPRGSWSRGARGPATLLPGGDPRRPPSGTCPRPFRTGVGDPAPGNRGAPARGVDVKPSPGTGSGRPRGGRKAPKTAKKADFSQNPRFWPFFRKTAYFRHFPGSRASPRGGFYINPSRRPPRNPPGPQKGGFPGFCRGGPKKALFRAFWPKIPILRDLALPGPRGPSRTPGVPRGPGARG